MARERRALARLYVLCAVLAGLFLMHGSPASAASGCHRTSATAVAATPMKAPAMALATTHGHRTTAAPGPTATPAEAGHSHPGEVCLATASQAGQPLAAPGAAPLAAAETMGAPALLSADVPRAPPSGGRDVLLRNCIART